MAETAEQRIRWTLTGSPVGEPHYQHAGDAVVRWLTGGTLPDLWCFFQHQDDQIAVRCAGCHNVLGSIPASYDREQTAQAILEMRFAGHEMHRPDGWPSMNIISS